MPDVPPIVGVRSPRVEDELAPADCDAGAVTTGGTVLRPPRHAAAGHARPAASPPVLRRVVEQAPVVLAVVVFAGCFLRIRQRWFIPGNGGFGYTTRVTQTTIDGTAIAPNQYRPLMPWVDHGLALAAGVPLPTAILATDAALTVALLVVLHRLAVRLGVAWLPLAAAAGWAWFAVKLEQWHPEIMLLAVIVASSVLLLAHRGRWPAPLGLLVLGGVACGARTDYAAGLAVVAVAVGVARRRALLAVAGVALGAGSIVATEALVRAYPQARYAVDVVQVPYNLTVGTLALDAAFYGALLVPPLALAVLGRRVPPLAVAVVWFLVEFAVVFAVGRTDESRIFMPLAPVLGAAAALAYRDLRALAAR